MAGPGFFFEEAFGERISLTDEEWAVIGPFLPAQSGRFCRPALSIAHYPVSSGTEFRDGDTIGPEDAFSFALRDTGRMKTGPV